MNSQEEIELVQLLLGLGLGGIFLLFVLGLVAVLAPGPRMPGGDYSWWERRQRRKMKQPEIKVPEPCPRPCKNNNPFHICN